MAKLGANTRFAFTFGNNEKQVLRVRIRGQSEENWTAFQSLREMLRCMCHLSARDSWLAAAEFFPKGQKTYSDEEVQGIRAQLADRYSDRLSHAPVEGSTLYEPGSPLSIRARKALHGRQIGPGKFTDEEINWVMARMEEQAIDLAKLPFQRTLGLWTFARRDPDKFHAVYGVKLMPKADTTASDEKRLVETERKEAEDATAAHQQLAELLGAKTETDIAVQDATDNPSHF